MEHQFMICNADQTEARLWFSGWKGLVGMYLFFLHSLTKSLAMGDGNPPAGPAPH
jgi:hypothetical protein